MVACRNIPSIIALAALALAVLRLDRGRRSRRETEARTLPRPARGQQAAICRPAAAQPALPQVDRPAPLRTRVSRWRIAASVLVVALSATGAIGGSYAAWTTQAANPGNSVTAGYVTLQNDKAGVSLFSPGSIRPGMDGSSTVVVSNKAGASQLPMLVTLSQQSVSSTFSSSLRWTLHDETRDWCYWPTNAAGACPAALTGGGAWNAAMGDLRLRPVGGGPADPWPAGEAHTFRVTWALATSSPNSDQGATATFDLAWTGAQVPA